MLLDHLDPNTLSQLDSKTLGELDAADTPNDETPSTKPTGDPDDESRRPTTRNYPSFNAILKDAQDRAAKQIADPHEHPEPER